MATFQIVVEAGVIDPDYTGEVTAVLHNQGDTPYQVNCEDRIVQLVLLQASIPTLADITGFDVPITSRGSDSFGSTETHEKVKTILEKV